MRVCIVGPGTRFLSGISYYTFCLCNSLQRHADVSAILIRRLLPKRLYPGRERVGADLAELELAPSIPRFDGIDWFWVPSLVQASSFLVRQRPDVLVLQWWTGTVLHTYLALALLARAIGTRVVVGFHEVLDPAEERRPFASRYVALLAPGLFRLAVAYVVHSEHDRRAVEDRYGIPSSRIEVVPHAAYDHYERGRRWRPAPERCCNLLYFGVIRPFKGVEDLVRAFDAIPEKEIDGYWLTLAGETWEGWSLPKELVAKSRHRDRITFVNRYVRDEEVDALFAGADVVVLPYHRSSQSGPLHIAMSYGLPVVVTAVGGLAEAVDGYAGAVLTQPGNSEALLSAIRQAADIRGKRFAPPTTWAVAAERYARFLYRSVDGPPGKNATTKALTSASR